MKIEVIKTCDVLTPSLRKHLATCSNPHKALEAMGLVIVSMAQRAFTNASLRPSAWAALSDATLASKRRAGYGSKPLINEGTLSPQAPGSSRSAPRTSLSAQTATTLATSSSAQTPSLAGHSSPSMTTGAHRPAPAAGCSRQPTAPSNSTKSDPFLTAHTVLHPANPTQC
jgi:hypothetical protein